MAKSGRARKPWKAAPGYHRFQKLKRRYGVDEAGYARMLADQKGVCLICEYAPSSSTKHLVIDHCHASTKVRGLLCQWCNKGLGFFKDNPKLLKRAILYLTKSLRSGTVKRSPVPARKAA